MFSPVTVRDLRLPVSETAGQLVLIGAAWWLAELMRAGAVPARVPGVLLSAAVVAATVLLTVAAWLGDDRRVRRVAAAFGVYAAVALLLRIAGDGAAGGPQVLGGSVAALGVVMLLALAVGGPAHRRRAEIALPASVLAVAVAVAATGLVAPGLTPPGAVVGAVDLVAWSGVGAAGVLLLVTGTVWPGPLLRRAGLAFATLGAANAVRIVDAAPARSTLSTALEVGAIAMMLAAAVPSALTAVTATARQQAAARARLAEADAVLAGLAERDHELRNLVAGLSGAARVLARERAGSSVDGQRLLVATGAELERLRRMLDRTPGGAAAGTGRGIAVGSVLRDLALVHRAGGLDVWVDVDGDPEAAVDPAALAQVLTNLLVNCAQHAPGARVWLRARTRGTGVRIEVADDGPGLPSGVRPRRGPRRAGDGLGLAISAEVVERHHGTLTLADDGGGCTVVIDLPRPVPGVTAVSA